MSEQAPQAASIAAPAGSPSKMKAAVEPAARDIEMGPAHDGSREQEQDAANSAGPVKAVPGPSVAPQQQLVPAAGAGAGAGGAGSEVDSPGGKSVPAEDRSSADPQAAGVVQPVVKPTLRVSADSTPQDMDDSGSSRSVTGTSKDDSRRVQFVGSAASSRCSSPGVVGPPSGDVTAVFPSASVTLVDWSDTIGRHYWGERFPDNAQCVRIYIAFLVLACIGGFLVLLSSSHLIPWYYSLLAVVLVTPHMVFDVMLWQWALMRRISAHVAILPPMLNNVFFLVLMATLSFSDESGGAISTMCLAVILVACNVCVLFYDAIHPSISRMAVVAALAILLSVYLTMVLAIYGNYMLVEDVEINFMGSFAMNAKSLVFNCLQNMVVIVAVQLLNRFYFPTDFLVLFSKMEVRTMRADVFQNFQRNTKETRRMSVGARSTGKLVASQRPPKSPSGSGSGGRSASTSTDLAGVQAGSGSSVVLGVDPPEAAGEPQEPEGSGEEGDEEEEDGEKPEGCCSRFMDMLSGGAELLSG